MKITKKKLSKILKVKVLSFEKIGIYIYYMYKRKGIVYTGHSINKYELKHLYKKISFD